MNIENTYCIEEKQQIAQQIKPITLERATEDFEQLRKIGFNAGNTSSRSRIGNDCVDYFTFAERLNTKGKYNANFYDFLQNIEEFKKKKFIQNMLIYYENVKNKNQTKNQYVVYKEVYNICISAINLFRPLVAMEIYARFRPKCVLDFTCGWGGRLIGACALNVPKYIGIDINKNLESDYQKMTHFLKDKTTTDISLYFEDAVTFDYSSLEEYDMVFTSPPYFFLEKYSKNKNYESKASMKTNFYEPLFKKTYESLKKGGVYCLNVNHEIYTDICVGLWGEADEEIPLKKSKRQNEYSESIYIWFHSTFYNEVKKGGAKTSGGNR
jgi:tRNA1(Val) A37 N6-methylase TrmN6